MLTGGIWGGLVSRGRAEKGLLCSRGPETQCNGWPTGVWGKGGCQERRLEG